jgi:hypothetical protein
MGMLRQAKGRVALGIRDERLNQLSSGLTAELERKENQSRPMTTGKCLYGHSEFELFDEIIILGGGRFHVDIV